MSLSTFADFDADSGAQLMESESLERRPSSDTRNHVSSRTLATQDSLSYQPPVIGDAASLEDLFVQEDRQERFLNSHVTALGRSLGELPELQTTPPQLTPPPTIFFPPETLTTDQPLSTFSLNVADVSFQLAAASLAQGQLPPPHTIRTEEFINALHYRDPEPPQGAPVGFAWDRARYPFTQQRDVLRLAVRTAAIGRHARQPLHVILVVDTSGSMERADRIATLHAALHALASQLGPADRLSAVTFARTARLVIDGVHGNDAPRLVERLLQTVPEGGTHLEEALRLGYQTALQHFIPGGVNRLILFTDGAANLGELQNAELQSIVETHRRRGIALDTFGIGWDGYDDERLAALARHGDGRYGFLNSPDDVASRFVRQLTGALEVAASDVKVQVEFHPDRVASWRQVGYAQHQLTAEQFRDDTVDAAELGAAESGNALYLIETLPQGSGPIATVRVRFRQPSSGIITEHTWAVPYTGLAPDLAEASPALRLAVAAAGLGERLSGNPLAAGISIPNLQDLMRNVAEWYHPDPAPARLQLMLQQAAPLLSP
jgi:secreted protein with Ig-like and vWFA domain